MDGSRGNGGMALPSHHPGLHVPPPPPLLLLPLPPLCLAAQVPAEGGGLQRKEMRQGT